MHYARNRGAARSDCAAARTGVVAQVAWRRVDAPVDGIARVEPLEARPQPLRLGAQSGRVALPLQQPHERRPHLGRHKQVAARPRGLCGLRGLLGAAQPINDHQSVVVRVRHVAHRRAGRDDVGREGGEEGVAVDPLHLAAAAEGV